VKKGRSFFTDPLKDSEDKGGSERLVLLKSEASCFPFRTGSMDFFLF